MVFHNKKWYAQILWDGRAGRYAYIDTHMYEFDLTACSEKTYNILQNTAKITGAEIGKEPPADSLAEKVKNSLLNGETPSLQVKDSYAILFASPDSSSRQTGTLKAGQVFSVNRLHFNKDKNKWYAQYCSSDDIDTTVGWVSLHSVHLTIFNPVFEQHQELSKKASKAVSGYYDF